MTLIHPVDTFTSNKVNAFCFFFMLPLKRLLFGERVRNSAKIALQQQQMDMYSCNYNRYMYKHTVALKCSYYGLWEVRILVLGVCNNRLTCMQGQKTHSLSYKMHLFLPYLLNDSQAIPSTIAFSKLFPVGNMLMFHVDVNMNWLGIRYKMTRLNDSESTLSLEKQQLYTRCTFRLKILQDVFIHLELCYTLHERSFSKIHIGAL